MTLGGGYTGISLAGRWECGDCAASGDGWWDGADGLTIHDADGRPFRLEDHICEDSP